MRQFIISAIFALTLFPATSLADCTGETFISCDTGMGRYLEVCIQPGDLPGKGAFTYRFGTGDNPELTLREDFTARTVTPWSGVSRTIWESVTFRNDGYSYEVWHSFDRLEEDASLEAGVTIMRDEGILAEIACEPGSKTYISPIFTLADAMMAAGYCLERHVWRLEGCG